jgi:hypothetical protein
MAANLSQTGANASRVQEALLLPSRFWRLRANAMQASRYI